MEANFEVHVDEESKKENIATSWTTKTEDEVK